MLGVYFRDYHRNIGSETVSGVVGHNGNFMLRILFLKSLYLVLLHVYSTENEIDLFCDLVYIL